MKGAKELMEGASMAMEGATIVMIGASSVRCGASMVAFLAPSVSQSGEVSRPETTSAAFVTSRLFFKLAGEDGVITTPVNEKAGYWTQVV